MRCRSPVVAIAAVLCMSIATMAEGANQGVKPELITFRSDDLALKGFIWKPEGPGPFPAILWNHGGEKLPGPVDSVAPYFVSRGYIFLCPTAGVRGGRPAPTSWISWMRPPRSRNAAKCSSP
jgi:dienelactone hydrolase